MRLLGDGREKTGGRKEGEGGRGKSKHCCSLAPARAAHSLAPCAIASNAPRLCCGLLHKHLVALVRSPAVWAPLALCFQSRVAEQAGPERARAAAVGQDLAISFVERLGAQRAQLAVVGHCLFSVALELGLLSPRRPTGLLAGGHARCLDSEGSRCGACACVYCLGGVEVLSA